MGGFGGEAGMTGTSSDWKTSVADKGIEVGVRSGWPAVSGGVSDATGSGTEGGGTGGLGVV